MNAPLRLPELWSALPPGSGRGLGSVGAVGAAGRAARRFARGAAGARDRQPDPRRVHLVGERIVIGKGARIAPGVDARRPAVAGRRRRDPHRRLRARRVLDRRRQPDRRQHRGQALDPARGSEGAAPQLRRRLDSRPRRQPRRRHRALQLPPRRRADRGARRRRARRHRTTQAGRAARRRRQDRLQQRAPSRRDRRAATPRSTRWCSCAPASIPRARSSSSSRISRSSQR